MIKQTKDPIFPDILWSRPENSQMSGKLLIVGGNKFEIGKAPGSFEQAKALGIVNTRVAMPMDLKNLLKGALAYCEFLEDGPSGSFNLKSLPGLNSFSAWGDLTLLIGDLGRSSETAQVLERLVQMQFGKFVVTRDAVDYFYQNPDVIFKRPNTIVALSFAQMQKMAQHYGVTIQFSKDLVNNYEVLMKLSEQLEACIITKQNENFIIVHKGQGALSQGNNNEAWRAEISTKAAAYWLHNSSKPFESAVTACLKGVEA